MIRTRKNTDSSLRLMALAAVALLHTTNSYGAAVAPNTPFDPGVSLDPGTTSATTASLAGTVLADQTIPFAESMGPWFTGTLRSVVVRRSDTSTLDFYYQIINTTPSELMLGDAEIYALAIESFSGYGFAGDSLEALYRTDGLTSLQGAGSYTDGSVAPVTAYRDAMAPDSIGFDFATDAGMPLFDPTNLKMGETTNFMVVRTSAVDYANTSAFVMGNFGTATTQGFAPIPEPTAVGLLGMGAMALGLRRQRTTR